MKLCRLISITQRAVTEEDDTLLWSPPDSRTRVSSKEFLRKIELSLRSGFRKKCKKLDLKFEIKEEIPNASKVVNLSLFVSTENRQCTNEQWFALTHELHELIKKSTETVNELAKTRVIKPVEIVVADPAQFHFDKITHDDKIETIKVPNKAEEKVLRAFIEMARSRHNPTDILLQGKPSRFKHLPLSIRESKHAQQRELIVFINGMDWDEEKIKIKKYNSREMLLPRPRRIAYDMQIEDKLFLIKYRHKQDAIRLLFSVVTETSGRQRLKKVIDVLGVLEKDMQQDEFSDLLADT